MISLLMKCEKKPPANTTVIILCMEKKVSLIRLAY